MARDLVNHDDAMKPPYPKRTALENFWVGEHQQVGETDPGEAWKTLPLPLLMHLFFWLISLMMSFNKLANLSLSGTSVSHASTLIEPKEEGIGASILQCSVVRSRILGSQVWGWGAARWD